MKSSKKKTTSKKKTSHSRKSKPKSMVDALFTSTQQNLFGLIFGQPERKFFATELIGLAGKGRGAVQRELMALTESGLINVETIGKQKYYSANTSSPIFHELRGIAVKTIGLVDPLRQSLSKVKAKIDFAAVYGSVAKGTAKAGSDIDLLIVSDEVGLEELYDVLAPVEVQLSRKINPTVYTNSEFKELVRSENPFIRKVLEGETIVLIGDRHAIKAT